MQDDLFSAAEPKSAPLPSEAKKPALELKGSSFTLPILQIMSTDIAAIESDLEERISQNKAFFEHAAFVVDVSLLEAESACPNYADIAAVMRRHHLVPVGVRGMPESQQTVVTDAGMAVLKGGSLQSLMSPSPEKTGPSASESQVTEVEPAPSSPQFKTMVVEQTVRSGQQIYARGADLVVLGAVNMGAEVIADGSIHVYGPLRGKAIAGASGCEETRIFAQAMEPGLVSIAGNYQVFEEHLPDSVHGKAGQAFLSDGKLEIKTLGS